MTKTIFARCFKREIGKAPTQYLTDLRIAQARQLLDDPKHFGVEAIAHSCGFADSLYFSTYFKNHVDCSPCNIESCIEKRRDRLAVTPFPF